ncbi:Clp protease N-terminal domain-containing protein [Sinomonas sp. G460-2]|uniref:Clp protease N-terminal domain-containing protein n=1 Tax=Sinomonas sp. G460-2 TaxID=3393464 RepID=UPI0039EE4FD8
MFERFARSARTAVEEARNEAARRGDRRIGTEHLLLALLQDAEVARIVGSDAAAAHRAADELDRKALAAIGLEIEGFQRGGPIALGRHALMTSGAKAVMGQTLRYATAEKARSITSRHMLLALIDQSETDPAAALLTALSVDLTALRERLADAA